MRVPLSWLREYVDLPPRETSSEIGERLVAVGLELEEIDARRRPTSPARSSSVASSTIEELTGFKKPIRWCQVEVGAAHGHPDTPGVRGIVCGARNFVAGDLVVVALPGAVLPAASPSPRRETYGHVSDGMICSERELGLGDDHDGIIVLPEGTAEVGADAGPVVGLGDVVLDVAVTPDMGFCLSMRGVARELAHAVRRPVARPGHRARRPARARRRRRRTRAPSTDLEGCDLFTLRTIVGFDPTAPSPYWMRRRLVDERHASGLARGRRHQLRHARDGPAAARVRPRQAARADRRAPGGAGGEARDARPRRAHARRRRTC